MLFEFLPVDSINYFLLIPKTIDLLLFAILGKKIYNLNRESTLNKIYCIAFISWAIYLLFDALIWIIAPYSTVLLQIGNMMRDIQMISLGVLSFLIFESEQVIRKGANVLFRTRFYVEMVLFGIVFIIILLMDSVVIYTNDNIILTASELPPQQPGFRASPNIPISEAIVAIIPILAYFYAMGKQIMLARKKISERTLRIRMYKLSIGLLFIPLGVIYFILQNVLMIYSELIVFVGYIFWTAAPILIWQSRRDSNQDDKTKSK